MTDAKKTKAQLIAELEALRSHVAELEHTAPAKADSTSPDSIFQKLFNDTHDALYVTTLDGQIIEYNAALLELLGCTADDIPNVNAVDFYVEPVERDRFRDVVAQDFSVRDFPIRLKSKDGRTIDCLDSTSALLDDQGNVIGYKGILHDVTELRAVEHQLRAERDRMQLYLNIAQTIIVALDREGHVTHVNHKGCQILDCDEQSIIGKLWFDVFVPTQEHKRMKRKYQAFMAGDIAELEYYENPIVPTSGGERLIAWHNALIHDADGAIVGSLSSGQDITERKQVENALRESEERYRALVDNAPVSILTAYEGRLTYVNPAGARLLGYADPEELLNTTIIDLIAPHSREVISERLTRLTAGEENPHVQIDVLRADGTTTTIESTSVPMILDGKPSLVTIGQDITERLEAQLELRAKEQSIESSLNGIAFADLDGKLNYINAAFLEMWGYTDPTDVLGRPAVDFWENSDEAQQVIGALAEEGVWIGEMVARRKDGRPFIARLAANIIADREDNPLRMMASFVDITAQREATDSLRRERDLVTRLMETSPVGITALKRTGEIIFANGRAEEILGLTTSEITDRIYNAPEWQITANDGSPFPDEELPFKQVINTGQAVYDVRHAIQWPDGKRVLLSINGAPIKDVNGDVIEVIATIEDITGRVEAEQAIKASEVRYRAIVEDQTEMIVRWQPDGMRTFVNEAYCRYFDATREELLGTSFFTHIDEKYHAVVREKFAQLTPENPARIDVHKSKKPDGNFAWQEWLDRAIYDDQGQLLEYQSVGRDVTDRVLAEQALKDSEERYRSIIEDQTELVNRWKPDGTCIFVNDAYCRFFKMSPDELIGRNFLPLILDEDRHIIDDVLGKLTTGSSLETHSTRNHKPDGTIAWMEWTNRAVYNSNGDLAEIQSVGRDVTDRVQMEQTLQRRDNILQAVNFAAGQLLADEDWTQNIDKILGRLGTAAEIDRASLIEFYKDASGKMLGRVTQQWYADHIDKELFIAAPPQAMPLTTDQFKRRFEQYDKREVVYGHVSDLPAFETEFMRGADVRSFANAPIYAQTEHWGTMSFHSLLAERDWHPIEIEALQTAAGILGAAIARQQGKQALLVSEERYEELFNTMLDGYALHEIILDDEGKPVDYRFIDVNPAWERATGLKHEDVVGKTVLEVLPGTEQHWIDNSGKVALTGEPMRYENYAAEQGKWFEVEAFSTQRGQFAVVFQDVTDRKLAELELEKYHGQLEDLVLERTSELQEALEKLAAMSMVKDEFVTNVSHELRTPIASLKLYHKLLELNPAKQERYLDQVKREIDRLNGLIESLLRLSRLEQDQIDIHLEPLDLSQLVTQYAADRRPLVMVEELELVVQPSPDLPQVSGDEELLGQVLSILLTNATNYTPAGGTITITTSAGEIDGQSYAGFSVSDTGPGITPEEQARLFERFFRGKAARNSGKPGTGLGLAIALEIIERHNGSIQLQSTGVTGEGANFTVWLPVVA